MFYYLNGVVAEMEANLAVIDCGGVGYACATTNYTLSQLKKGERAKLYTYMNVREDAVELFGFAVKVNCTALSCCWAFPAWAPRRRCQFSRPIHRPIWPWRW